MTTTTQARAYAPVVTGMGAVTPFGWGVAPLVDGLFQDRRAFTDLRVVPAEGQRTKLAGEVSGDVTEAEALQRGCSPPLAPAARRRLARTDVFALAAAAEALESAGWTLDELERRGDRVGLFFGSSTGAMREGEEFYYAQSAAPEQRLGVRGLATQQNQGPGDTVARLYGLRGPRMTFATACAAATMALEAAWLSLRAGEIDVALVGGSDGLCRLTYAGFNSLRAVSAEPCQPFRSTRDGLTLGEGSGVLVLERPSLARARGARARARLLGAASTCDAHHMTAPQPEGDGLARALERALRLAGVAPTEVGFVNAHGTGTPHNDAAEAAAFLRIFGDALPNVPVTSTKGAIGHLLGSAGAVEAVVTVHCLQEGRVHPTPGEDAADPGFGVDLVRRAPRLVPRARVAVSTNLAFGGANAALVFGRDPNADPSRAATA